MPESRTRDASAVAHQLRLLLRFGQCVVCVLLPIARRRPPLPLMLLLLSTTRLTFCTNQNHAPPLPPPPQFGLRRRLLQAFISCFSGVGHEPQFPRQLLALKLHATSATLQVNSDYGAESLLNLATRGVHFERAFHATKILHNRLSCIVLSRHIPTDVQPELKGVYMEPPKEDWRRPSCSTAQSCLELELMLKPSLAQVCTGRQGAAEAVRLQCRPVLEPCTHWSCVANQENNPESPARCQSSSQKCKVLRRPLLPRRGFSTWVLWGLSVCHDVIEAIHLQRLVRRGQPC